MKHKRHLSTGKMTLKMRVLAEMHMAKQLVGPTWYPYPEELSGMGRVSAIDPHHRQFQPDM